MMDLHTKWYRKLLVPLKIRLRNDYNLLLSSLTPLICSTSLHLMTYSICQAVVGLYFAHVLSLQPTRFNPRAHLSSQLNDLFPSLTLIYNGTNKTASVITVVLQRMKSVNGVC